MRHDRRRMWKILPLLALGFVAVVFLGGEIVKLLWNWLLPPIFGWPAITFWQALGLLALCRILFGGFGGRGGGWRRSGWRRRSPEEREQLRQRMQERFGEGPVASD
jgi:hypothetical protein